MLQEQIRELAASSVEMLVNSLKTATIQEQLQAQVKIQIQLAVCVV